MKRLLIVALIATLSVSSCTEQQHEKSCKAKGGTVQSLMQQQNDGSVKEYHWCEVAGNKVDQW